MSRVPRLRLRPPLPLGSEQRSTQPDDIARTVLYLLSLSGRAHVDQIYIRRRTGKPF